MTALLLLQIAAHLRGPMSNLRLAFELSDGVIEVGLYTAYLLLSKRVKATFVVRRPRPPAILAAATSSTAG